VALAASTPMGVGGSRFCYASGEAPAESAYMGSFRRDFFERFGIFEEGSVRNQDDEFDGRVRKRGGSVWLASAMKSVHSQNETPWLLSKQYFQYGYYKVRIAALHPGMIRLGHVMPTSLVLALAALAATASFRPAAAALLFVLLAGNAGLSPAFGAREGARDPEAWLLTPAATLDLHLTYGSGFLAGLLAALAGRTPGLKRPSRGIVAS